MFGVRGEDRARSLAIVLATHVLLAWLVLSFAHSRFVRDRDAVLDVFDVRPVTPPPPVEPAPTPSGNARRSALSEGASAAPRPAPPPPERGVLPPVAPVIVPVSGGRTFPSAGGPSSRMSGGGGTGSGAGPGSAGAGPGAGGSPAVAARLRGGRIVPRDYPRAAGGNQGVVTAHVAVGVDGRVTGCTVARSSGSAVLDATTCRLIRERFRFAPARNAQGEAVPDLFGWQQRWWRD